VPETKPIIAIVNVVASASVDQKIDLNEVLKQNTNSYQPKRFPGIVIKTVNPKASTLLFST